MKNKKMKLDNLKVKSFTTSISNPQEVKGGGITTVTTATPITIPIVITCFICTPTIVITETITKPDEDETGG